MRTARKLNTFIITLVLFCALLGTVTRYILPARAGVACTLPFTLVNGTVADATQVMSNYNALVSCLGNAAAAGVNSDITVLSGLTTPLNPAEGGTSVFYGGTTGGSANAQTLSPTVPANFSLVSGYQVLFTAGFTNTGATTLTVNGTTTKNVFRRTPSGTQALTGGEIQLNAQYTVSYDGTQYELLNNSAEFGGFGALTTLASAATTDLGTIPTHNVNLTGVTTITSFGSTASATYPMYRILFSNVLTLTFNASSMILPGGANITTAANDLAVAQYLGSGNWAIVSYTRQNGQSVVPSVDDVQTFTATGANTWTRAAGVSFVRVILCGAGGGGAGGGRQAAGLATPGGGGGGGGYCHDVTYKAADAGASQTVTIATGGTAGAGATVNGSVGTNGGVGGNSTFGTLLTAFGGGGGANSTSGGAGGGGGGPDFAGLISSGGGNGGASQFSAGLTSTIQSNGGSEPQSATSPTNLMCAGAPTIINGAGAVPPASASSCPYGGAGGAGTSINGSASTLVGGIGGSAGYHGPGGGGGGSFFTDNTNRAGGNGGKSAGCPTAAAGGAAGSNPGGSTAANFNYFPGCGGGGGGSAQATGGGAGGAGTSAGGGGGGGAGDGVNGGAGGVGGNGFALVVSW